jgi:catechol 2,3-dioxygenase-like lactoylglutathione lyase family enzyme
VFKHKEKPHHVNPRFRAYGKARIDIARRAQNQDDWYELWKKPTHSFPFFWGDDWKQCVEYKVDDFAAEVGFYTDILGLPVNAFDPDYAMFTSPDKEFFFSIVPALEGQSSTPPDSFRMQFMVRDLWETVEELQRRGVVFEQLPRACQEGSALHIGFFRSPHGICIDLWGFMEPPKDTEEEFGHSSGNLHEADKLNDMRLSGESEKEIDSQRTSGDNERTKVEPDENFQIPGENEGEYKDEEEVDGFIETEYVVEEQDSPEEVEYFNEDNQDSLWKIRYS